MDQQYAEKYFFNNLPAYRQPLSSLLEREEYFCLLPQQWHVITTDLKGSTKEVLGGRQERINRTATASTAVVLNIAAKQSIDIPFFFGGDGTTFLVPPCILRESMNALRAYSAAAQRHSQQLLRVGNIAVSELHGLGHSIKIAKYEENLNAPIPIIIGSGLQHAEMILKSGQPVLDSAESTVDLTVSGMLCRWDHIPPGDEKEIVTLVVCASKPALQRDVLSQVMKKLENTYGEMAQRQPITRKNLRLKSTFKNVVSEQMLLSGKIGLLGWITLRLLQQLGKFYYKLPLGRKQLSELIKMSDTLVVDGRISTVIAGNKSKRMELLDFLQDCETRGKLYYGMHISQASVMSCYVHNAHNRHYYFVDGADGGFTRAASIMKAKMITNTRRFPSMGLE